MHSAATTRLLTLLGIEHPIIQAPMAGSSTPEMAIAVSEAGGLGSLPSALYSESDLRAALDQIRTATRRPINLNFFSHTNPADDPVRQTAWAQRLASYYIEFGLDPNMDLPATGRAPFNAALTAVVEEYRPEIASFHFGLPAAPLLARVKATGAKVIASATNVPEARWLVDHGVDAVIAMGAEAGGHRGHFLSDDLSNPIGTFALVPQIVDAVAVPVIAAGGIVDRRGVMAALALGAAAVQVGTAYLMTPEAKIAEIYRRALAMPERATAFTNLFTGRPARGIVNRVMRELGPISTLAPAFPTAGGAIAPLRRTAEAAGSDDFSPLWAGQGFPLAQPMSATALTRMLAGI